MSNIHWGRAIPVILLVVMTQVEIADQRWILGLTRVDLPLILVVGIAAVGAAPDAAKLGFTVGLVVDFFQFGPFGLNALIMCLVAWSLAVAKVRLLEPGALYHSFQSSVAVVLATVANWTVAAIFGLTPPVFGLRLLPMMALVALSAAILVHPATATARLFAEGPSLRESRGGGNYASS